VRATTGSSPLFWTLAATGLRVSEACQLRWDDVSLDLGRLFVARSKSEGGRRLVTLDPTTVTLLQAHREAQEHRRALLGADWQEHGMVFDRGDGRPVSPRTVQAAMARLVRALGLPYGTPHTLRHTHATLLLRAGVPLHVVRARLGHASPVVTLRFYAHAVPADEVLVARTVAALLEPKVGDQRVTMAGEERRETAS
jgi:integrase